MFAVFDMPSQELVEITNYTNELTNAEKTVYVNGSIDYVVNKDYTLSHIKSNKIVEDFLKFNLCGNFSVISVVEDKFSYARVDPSALNELYYSFGCNELVISDNIFELINELEKLEINGNNIDFFLKKGYCRSGETYFSNVFRIPPTKLLTFNKDHSDFTLKNCFNEYFFDKIDYSVFKNALESTISLLSSQNKKNLVLLSGGLDSSVIAGVLKNYGLDVSAITLKMEPCMNFNISDIKRSEKISEKLDLKREIVSLDFDRIHEDDFQKILTLIPKIPFSPHLGYNFIKIFESTPNNHNLWCGQNSDALYNFSITPRFLYINRFLLSNIYLKMVPGVKGSNRYKILKKSIDHLLEFSLNKIYHKKFKSPKNIHQLLYFFNESENYLAFSDKNQTVNIEHSPNILSSNDVTKMILDEKMGSYVTGGDHKLVVATAEFLDRHVLFPYSYGNMVLLYRNLYRGIFDVFYPKRFLYLYAKKELGLDRNFFYKDQNSNCLNVKKWEKEILHNSSFGRLIRENINNMNLFNCSKNDNLNLNEHIHLLWISQVIKTINDMKVRIC